MKYPKTFLAILIIVGAIFAVAFWSNIVKAPPTLDINNGYVAPSFKELSSPLSEFIEELGEDMKG